MRGTAPPPDPCLGSLPRTSLRRTAQNFVFFPSPDPMFSLSLSLGVFSFNLGCVFEGHNPQTCTFGLLGCRVKPRRPLLRLSKGGVALRSPHPWKLPLPSGNPTLRPPLWAPPFGLPTFGRRRSGPPLFLGLGPLRSSFLSCCSFVLFFCAFFNCFYFLTFFVFF